MGVYPIFRHTHIDMENPQAELARSQWEVQQLRGSQVDALVWVGWWFLHENCGFALILPPKIEASPLRATSPQFGGHEIFKSSIYSSQVQFGYTWWSTISWWCIGLLIPQKYVNNHPQSEDDDPQWHIVDIIGMALTKQISDWGAWMVLWSYAKKARAIDNPRKRPLFRSFSGNSKTTYSISKRIRQRVFIIEEAVWIVVSGACHGMIICSMLLL